MKTVLIAAFISITLAILSTNTAYAHLDLTGPVVTTAVSGKSGSTRIVGPGDSDYRALYSISSRERDDKPCRVSASAYHLNLDNTSAFEADLCGSKGSTSSAISAFTSVAATGGFISGIQACLNKDQTRVKGFEIATRKIDRKADLVDYGSGHRASRTNCKKWQAAVSCPADHLATAVVVHYSPGSPSIIKGLALQCREVVKRH